ncbi:MAG TPA: DNA primase [Pseudomonadales bacterium]|nr:DNA primase [Pseudomonadales bacterium]
MVGQIPRNFIDDLVERADIVDIIDARVKLKKAGRNYQALCPFHDEKSPSFSVNPDKQFYYCFGCGAGGNVLSFIMDYERLDFPQAIENLAHYYGLEVPREQLNPQQEQTQKRKRDLYDIMEGAARFYREQLTLMQHSQVANAYVRQRGISPEIAQQFGIGFAPDAWDKVLNHLFKDQSDKAMMMDSGLIVENDKGRIYDRFRNRLMFPIRDNRGRCIGFGGRVFGDEKPKYLNSPETPIFHKGKELYGLYEARQALRDLPRLVIVEGYMDVVSLAQHGIRYAVATLGTASSAEHLELAFRHTSEVVFCFDGDEAGRKAARRAFDNALPTIKDGRQIRFLFLPDGEDPDTLVRQRGSEFFAELIHKAQPLEEFLFNIAAEGIDTRTMDGRARFSQVATALIGHVPDGIFKTLLVSELARRTGVSEDRLQALTDAATSQHDVAQWQREQVKFTPNKRPTPKQDKSPPLPAPSASNHFKVKLNQSPAQKAICLLIHHPLIAHQVHKLDTLTSSGDDDIALLVDLISLIKQQPYMDTATLFGHVAGGENGAMNSARLAAYAALDPLIPDDGFEREFLDIIDHLQHQLIHQQRQSQRKALLDTPFSEMSPEQKRELLLSLQAKQRKKS